MLTHRGFSLITIDRSTTLAILAQLASLRYDTVVSASIIIITVNIILIIDALQLLSHAPRSEQTVVAEALK